RIPWIKWDVVCLPKRKGGLGVRDLRVVNISLLAKWRWRLLSNNNPVWKEVIKCKYGDSAVGELVLGDGCKPWFASLWWKDICSIGCNLNNDWFAKNVVKLLGNGTSTRFWEDNWVGNTPLKERFPRLYSMSIQKDAKVINPINLSDAEDRWGWVPDKGEEFSVKSTFFLISELLSPMDLIPNWYAQSFTAIWKCPAPSKVNAFAWQLLHDRIPTRQNLYRRRIIDGGGNTSCVLCGEPPA
ncbi:ribonuclease H protein, partial [Trifolium medium]|nr:ribonuclease H protein [Trifolium medium]